MEFAGNIDMNGYGLLRKNSFFVKEGGMYIID